MVGTETDRLPIETDDIIERFGFDNSHLDDGVRLDSPRTWCGEINIHEYVDQYQVNPFGTGLNDQRVDILALSIGEVFEQPVSLPLMANIVGGGQGAAQDGGEILAHLFGKARLLSSDYTVQLVLHDQVKQPPDW